MKVLWKFASMEHGEQSATTTGEDMKLKWHVDSLDLVPRVRKRLRQPLLNYLDIIMYTL